MGNTDSKSSRRSSVTPATASGAHRARVSEVLEAEFKKRSDQASGLLSKDGFQACLRIIQEEFEMYTLSDSPLGIGLFEISATRKEGGRALMNISEYASAMAVLFNNVDSPTMKALTIQAIVKWFASNNPTNSEPSVLTDDILVAYFDASWKAAWREMCRRLISNVRLNGKAESEAIQRFSETHSKYFNSHRRELAGLVTQFEDRTITISVGDEMVIIPTSFSYISNKSSRSETPPKGGKSLAATNQALYPDL